jgi:NAD(P)-dependent dehydrogenase (short-subunit alcohol dehydrogenase family)
LRYAGYAASKGAVEAITMILARELRGRDVTVNAVAPGPTATALLLDGKDQETIARMALQPPLERLGTRPIPPITICLAWKASAPSPLIPAVAACVKNARQQSLRRPNV